MYCARAAELNSAARICRFVRVVVGMTYSKVLFARRYDRSHRYACDGCELTALPSSGQCDGQVWV